jgi:predicted  nucleic acid-binding Zn-ribbon protein
VRAVSKEMIDKLRKEVTVLNDEREFLNVKIKDLTVRNEQYRMTVDGLRGKLSEKAELTSSRVSL